MTGKRLRGARYGREVTDAELCPLRRLRLEREQHPEARRVGEKPEELGDFPEPCVTRERRERSPHRLEMHHFNFAAVRGELPLELLTRQRRASTGRGGCARS